MAGEKESVEGGGEDALPGPDPAAVALAGARRAAVLDLTPSEKSELNSLNKIAETRS